MVRTATDLYNYLQCFSRRDCNRKEVEDPPLQQTMAGPDRIFPEEHHQAKMYLKKPADSATTEDEKCQDIYDGANNQEEDNSVPITGRTIQRGSRGYESLLPSLGHRQLLNSNYVVITHL